MKGKTQNQGNSLTLSGEVSSNPKVKELIEMCGDCVDFDMCDFVNFSVFFSGSKAFGSGCTDKVRRDALLAWSLGLALVFESENGQEGEATLGDQGICMIIKKIGSLINNCCSLPEFYGPSKSDNGGSVSVPPRPIDPSIPTTPGGPSAPGNPRRLTDQDIVNERLGLTPHSDKVKQENIKLDPSYQADCSTTQEMLPGAHILGLKVIGIAHNGKNISVKRDSCLKSGKVWNTLNDSCYCLDEKDTPNIVVGDRKVDKKYFHLSPPKNWSGVSKVQELNLDKEGINRFTAIISEKENINLDTLRRNTCAVGAYCKWYSCLIDGITNYFLGCPSNPSTGIISSCYYDYNLQKSNLDKDIKNQILNNTQNSFNHCCDKCYQSGCECKKVGAGCVCVGTDNRGIPCSQITAKSAGKSLVDESNPVLKTDSFDSDAHVIRSESRLVTCCDRTITCPPGATDGQCCEELCNDDTFEKIISKIPPSKITRVRNVDPEKGIEWKCTSHADCSFGCCDSHGMCGGSKPCGDEPELRIETSSDIPVIPTTPDTDLFGCCTRRDGCCTCRYLSGIDHQHPSGQTQFSYITWGCCCSGSAGLKRCCRRRGYGNYGPIRGDDSPAPTTSGY